MLKSIQEMTPNDKKALAQVLQWRNKNLYDCSRSELVDCVLHFTAQLAAINDKAEREKKRTLLSLNIFGFILKVERKVKIVKVPAQVIMEK